MAIDSKLKNVGAAAAQLSNKLSFNEKTQINAIKNVGGLSSKAGKLKSDVSGAISKINRTTASAMNLGAELAGKLEAEGVFNKNAKGIIDGALQSTVQKKINLPTQFPKLPVDVSNWQNRIPNGAFKTAEKKIKDTQESLLGIADLRYNGIQYPPDLPQEAAAYLKLQFFEYTRGDPFAPGSLTPVEHVSLPLPDMLAYAYNVKYQERDTGIMGDVMNSQAATDAMTAAQNKKGADAITGAISSLTGSFGEMTAEDAAGAAGQVAKRAGFAALEGANDIAGGLAGQIVGSIPNPHPTVFFKGLELRQFNWQWKFVPRSEAEANTLQQAIQMIKKFILPRKDSNFLKYPHMVLPVVEGQNVEMYGKFKKSLVSQFSVNYTAEGQSAFFVDGNPVAVLCMMTFQEVENFTADDA